MADKTLKVKVQTEIDVQPTLAGLRDLKKELKELSVTDPKFAEKQQQIDDYTDALKAAKIGAGSFVDVLGQIPGPLGDIGNKVGGTITTLKQFGALKFSDIKGSFVELGKDVVDVGKGIGNLTGITKLYEFSVSGLTKTMTALGIAEQGAAVAAQRLSGALIATGIGALVVAVGYLIANFDELTESILGTTAAEKAYNSVNEQAVKTSGELIVNETALIQKIQKGGLTRQEQIHVLNEWNAKHKDSNLLFNDYKKLQDYVVASGPQYIEYIKAKAKADANYSLILLKQKELLETQVKSPAEFRKWYDYFSDQAIFGKIGDVDAYRKSVASSKINIEIDALAAQTDKLTKEAADAAKKAGVVSTEKFVPTTTTATGAKGETPAQKAARLKKEAEAIQAELDKYAEEVYKKTLDARNKELYDAGKHYNKLRTDAIAHGKDITGITEAYLLDQSIINKKYDDIDAKNKEDRLAKEKEFWAKAKKDADEKRVKEREDKLKEDALIKGDEDARLARIMAGASYDFALRSEMLEQKKAADKKYYEEQLANEKLTAEQIRELNDRKLKDQIYYTEESNKLERDRAAVRQQVLSDIITIAGAESDVGRAALVAKQILLARELYMEATKTITFSAQAAARSTVAVAEGTAQTAKVGFPQNIPLLIGYAAQAIGIIAAIRSAVSSAKSSAQMGGAGGSIPNVSTPPPVYTGAGGSMSTPQIQTTGGMNPTTQIAQTLGNAQAPVKAYVVSGEISSAQALDRRTSRAATLS